MIMKRYLPSRITLCISFVMAMIFLSIILYMAFDHNPQGEFYQDYGGGVQWEAVIRLGLSSFLIAFLFIFLIAYMMEMLWKADEHLLKDGERRKEERNIGKDE
ncbi:hypothetical protein Swit_4455 [Rhizorhabdus wittichii RW1]|uniref:Uncharacterized protein n=1 Tax=Rhizorhabdus wittichii (strain DSM 6014 / CCUG 31198 / JCM 15750 / NBRC 105917 / EY 4224 / RW1) TaxID=392499 RepID=A0A9J9HFH0_RHIWR|nr:hypothetical protein Swit_4455 [Rhizorhabdus wittichii RW1]